MEYLLTLNFVTLGKILFAALLGAILGIERELARKEAGIRTNSFVSMGACLFSLIAWSLFENYGLDPGRISSQIVVGVGFIGAGMIIFHEHKVRGLTTAAELWLSAGIGMAIAFGFYTEALFTVGLIIVIVTLSSKFKSAAFPEDPSQRL